MRSQAIAKPGRSPIASGGGLRPISSAGARRRASTCGLSLCLGHSTITHPGIQWINACGENYSC